MIAPHIHTRPRSQGCWHLPAGAGNDWLCIDIPRGLRMGLDKLSGAIGSGTTAVEGRKLMTAEGSAGGEGDEVDGDMIREVRPGNDSSIGFPCRRHRARSERFRCLGSRSGRDSVKNKSCLAGWFPFVP